MHARQAAAGDERSIAWIVDRFSPLLLAQARYRLGPAARQQVPAEDLVHETWAVALPRLGTLEPREGRLAPVLMKYLSNILLNRVNQAIRGLIRDRQREPNATLDDLAERRERGVITNAMRREIRETIHDELLRLSEREREILVLRLLEQRTGTEVADALGISRENVYTRYHRALQVLRSRLPDSWLDELDPDPDDPPDER
ncbi:MAG: sigma-70 family RNA polymerase sigma factor [Planctomycetota bacterium]